MTLICLETALFDNPLSIIKSCPRGLRPIASKMADFNLSLPPERKATARLALSSCPSHKYNLPVQVILTRLQLSQKLCVNGVISPSRFPVFATSKYLAGPGDW